MLKYLALFALLFAAPAAAQDHSFPTPGNAVVPGYVTMCINGSNQAIPCAAGGGLAAGAAVTGCPAGANLFVTSGLLLGCSANLTEGDTGTPLTSAGVISLPATGSASATNLNFGTAGTGIFGTSTTISFGIATANQAFLASTGFTLNAGNLSLPAASNIGWGGAAFLYGPAAATFRFGGNAAAAPIAQTLGMQNVSAGTSNTGGVNFTLNGSQSTGTGVGGKIILQTSLTGLTGTTVNSNFPMFTINPGAATTATVQFGDGTNFTTYDSCTALTTSATGVVACTASAIRFKDMFPAQALNLIGLDALRADIPWKYKDDVGHGLDPTRLHVGLFADDVEKLDPRCVVYRDGAVSDYEDRCMIAYLVADRKRAKEENDDLRRKVDALIARIDAR